jgi:hypothetical protein
MAGLRELLRARAFHEDAGPAYNQTSHAVREGDPERRIAFYEVVLATGSDWAWLRDTVVPNLARHLEWKRHDPALGDGVVVTIFDGDRFLLVHTPDLLALYREQEGLAEDAFRARVAAWVGRPPPAPPPAISRAPLALPGRRGAEAGGDET